MNLSEGSERKVNLITTTEVHLASTFVSSASRCECVTV